jgi:hypothetical protein
MKVLNLPFGLWLALCGSLWCADNHKPDFTGKWELNVSKSNFGKMSKPVSMSLQAEQRGPVFHASQTTTDQHGSETVESDWIVDGKEHELTGKGGGKLVCKWDGSTLVSQKEWDNGQYKETTKLTLSKDGKVATEKIDSKNPNGENHATLVWERR